MSVQGSQEVCAQKPLGAGRAQHLVVDVPEMCACGQESLGAGVWSLEAQEAVNALELQGGALWIHREAHSGTADEAGGTGMEDLTAAATPGGVKTAEETGTAGTADETVAGNTGPWKPSATGDSISGDTKATGELKA